MDCSPGVDRWDFAYNTGRCELTCSLNSFDDQKSDTQSPCPIGQQNKDVVTITQKEVGSKQSPPPKRPFLRSWSSREPKSKQQEGPQTKAYLLSYPTVSCSYYSHSVETISTMLMTPHTQLVLLVPQSEIVCPKVCALMRIKKAQGSSIKILPVPPSITMETAPVGVDGNADAVDMLDVNEVAQKIFKYTKVKRFDGYMSLEDFRMCWVFLERVGREVARLGEAR